MGYYGSLGAVDPSGQTATVLVQAYTVKKYPGGSASNVTYGKASTIGATKVGAEVVKGPYGYPTEAKSVADQINAQTVGYSGGLYRWSRARVGAVKQAAMTGAQWQASGQTRGPRLLPPGTVVNGHGTAPSNSVSGIVGPDGHTIVDPTTGQKVGDTSSGGLPLLPILIGGGLLLVFFLRRRA